MLYHANCPDGYAAAFACWQRLGDDAQYIPVSYGQPVPAIPEGHTVYIVDFSYPEDTLKALRASRHAPIIVLDHHASAKRDLEQLRAQEIPGLDIHFDLNESGASLTWKYLAVDGDLDPIHATGLEESLPTFFRYVRDRDLWRWQLPDSKAVSLAYWAIEKDMPTIQTFAQACDDPEALRQIKQRGLAMEWYADRLVAEQAARAILGHIAGYTVPIVNATTLFSEVGDFLCRHQADVLFAAYYFDRNDAKRQWGLRSRGAFDCSIVAKQYGGGGHPGAAGFITEQSWRGEEAYRMPVAALRE